MKLKTIVVSALAVGMLAACGSTGGTPIPQATDAAPAATSEAPADKASSCDVVREAFLTGTPAELKASLKVLKADKTADATAREYAGYFLGRDAKDKSFQEMDATVIQSACSL